MLIGTIVLKRERHLFISKKEKQKVIDFVENMFDKEISCLKTKISSRHGYNQSFNGFNFYTYKIPDIPEEYHLMFLKSKIFEDNIRYDDIDQISFSFKHI